jgi:hypothetical protein
MSKRLPGFAALVCGMMNHAMTVPMTPNGTFTQNTPRQSSASTIQPPTVGPAQSPTACTAVWIPRARPKSLSPATDTMMATLLADSIAAPTACSARAAMSQAMSGAKPQRVEPFARLKEKHPERKLRSGDR